MKPLISIPIAIIILVILFCEFAILFIPAVALNICGKDSNLSWMFKWAYKPLELCGFKII